MCKWDLHRLGEVGLVPGGGRLDKSHGRPIRWSGLHRPPTFNTDSSFSSSCRHVATKAWVEQPQTLAGRPLVPLGLGSSSHVHMSNTPCGDDDFDIWSTSLCHPLKCSNLVP
jgi:hypothetical protein